MSLYKRGKTWYMNITVDGKRVNRSTGKKTLESARKMMEQTRKTLKESAGIPEPIDHQSEMTLSKALDRMNDERWSRRKDGHRSFARIMYLIDTFGDLPLSEITARWISNIKSTMLAEGRAVATVNRYLAHLRTILLAARDE